MVGKSVFHFYRVTILAIDDKIRSQSPCFGLRSLTLFFRLCSFNSSCTDTLKVDSDRSITLQVVRDLIGHRIICTKIDKFSSTFKFVSLKRVTRELKRSLVIANRTARFFMDLGWASYFPCVGCPQCLTGTRLLEGTIYL